MAVTNAITNTATGVKTNALAVPETVTNEPAEP